VHYQLFLCYQRRGESPHAKQAQAKFKSIEADLNRMNELTEKIQQHPQDAELRFRVAEIFLRRHEEREGIHWLHTVLNLDPAHAGARRLLAATYDGAGRPHQARTYDPTGRP
jgi:cytochrome c-type biogenesis protein CcmH/NrfG